MNGSIGAAKAALYIVAQLYGAVLGALVIRATFGEQLWQATGYGKPTMMAGIDPTIGLILEMFMTTLLVVAVFLPPSIRAPRSSAACSSAWRSSVTSSSSAR